MERVGHIAAYRELCDTFCASDYQTRVNMREIILPALEKEIASLRHGAEQLANVGMAEWSTRYWGQALDMEMAVQRARKRLVEWSAPAGQGVLF